MGSDKQKHGLWKFYETNMEYLKNKKIRVLELGVFQGDSLLYMSNKMFLHKDTEIIGVDILEPPLLNDSRIKCYKLSQTDNSLLDLGKFDVIIDDASHNAVLTQKSFNLLWGQVNKGGWYIIEDFHPSILPEMNDTVNNILSNLKNNKVVKFIKNNEPVAASVMIQK